MNNPIRFLLLALCLLTAPMAQAQEEDDMSMSAPQADNGHRREQMRAQMQQARAYVKDKVAPALLAERQQLETQLSAQAKQQIADARAKIAYERKNLAPILKQSREARQRGEMPSPLQREALKAHRASVEKIAASLRPLADSLQPFFGEMQQRLASQRAQWEADLQALRPQQSAQGRKGRRGDAPQGRRMDPLSRLQEPVAFLLMNPQPREKPAQGQSVSEEELEDLLGY